MKGSMTRGAGSMIGASPKTVGAISDLAEVDLGWQDGGEKILDVRGVSAFKDQEEDLLKAREKPKKSRTKSTKKSPLKDLDSLFGEIEKFPSFTGEDDEIEEGEVEDSAQVQADPPAVEMPEEIRGDPRKDAVRFAANVSDSVWRKRHVKSKLQKIVLSRTTNCEFLKVDKDACQTIGDLLADVAGQVKAVMLKLPLIEMVDGSKGKHSCKKWFNSNKRWIEEEEEDVLLNARVSWVKLHKEAGLILRPFPDREILLEVELNCYIRWRRNGYETPESIEDFNSVLDRIPIAKKSPRTLAGGNEKEKSKTVSTTSAARAPPPVAVVAKKGTTTLESGNPADPIPLAKAGKAKPASPSRADRSRSSDSEKSCSSIESGEFITDAILGDCSAGWIEDRLDQLPAVRDGRFEDPFIFVQIRDGPKAYLQFKVRLLEALVWDRKKALIFCEADGRNGRGYFKNENWPYARDYLLEARRRLANCRRREE